jgi:hypothetical protein
VAKEKPGFRPKPYQPTLFGKGRGPPIKPEELIQIAIVEWSRIVAPDVMVIHIPNEGERSSVSKIFLTKLGMIAGAADLLIIADGPIVALAEVKAQGKYPDAKQRWFLEECKKKKVPAKVLRSIDDARAFWAEIGIQTREHLRPTQLDLLEQQ